MIRRISENFVPCAVNLYKVRKATDGSEVLFKWMLRQQDQYQGIWIINDAGSVLAAHHAIKDHKTWAD